MPCFDTPYDYLCTVIIENGMAQNQMNKYSIFELRVKPTFDFQQELLWNGEDLEVLEPMWLRKEIAGKVRRMWDKYKKNESKCKTSQQ